MSKIQYTESDHIKAIEIRQRAKGNRLTPDDHKILESVPTGQRSYYESALWYADYVREQIAKQRYAKLEQGLLFPLANETAAAPNIIFRGSLFQPVARGKRKWREDFPVAEWGDSTLHYSGATLDQGDLDVLLALNRVLARDSQTDNVSQIVDEDGNTKYSVIKFTSHGLLKTELKRSTGGKDYKWLHKSLNRLKGSLVANHDGLTYSGSIIGDWGFDEHTDLMYVSINHSFVKLFGTGHTLLGWDERLKLKGFAKWLQGFVCTHKGIQFQTTRGIMDLCNSTTKRDRDFSRQSLKPAFEELEKVKIIKWFKIEGHKISWER